MLNVFDTLQENITIDVSPDKIKDLIREIAKQYYPDHEVTGINFDVVAEWTGYGQAEHEVPKFRGIKVMMTRKKK